MKCWTFAWRRTALVLAAFICSGWSSEGEPPVAATPPHPRPETGPTGLSAEPPPIEVRADPVRLAPARQGRLRFLSGVALSSSHPLWGGLSGLELDGDGEAFLALSDRGALFSGRLLRRDGEIVGVETTQSAPLLDPEGRPLPSDAADAEGLARAPDGALFVSFEFVNQVLRYPAPGAAAEVVPTPPEVAELSQNSGLEALALSPEGVLVAIPERSGDEARPFPVYLRDPAGGWSEQALGREPPFLPTDADFGPDGRLYVLERDFSLLGWFRARLRVAELGPEGLGPVEILAVLTGVDNAEGLALWRDAQGRTRVVVVSDDNFNPLQRTLILEFVLEDSG